MFGLELGRSARRYNTGEGHIVAVARLQLVTYARTDQMALITCDYSELCIAYFIYTYF